MLTNHNIKKSNKTIDIIIDDREVSTGVVEIMRNIDGISPQVQRLTVGDYEVDGRLLVERKTLLDFTQSLKDGRLFSQASRLVAAPQQGRATASGALPRHGKRPRGKRRTQLYILQGLPGVGPDRAQALLTHFGSVEAVFGANEHELELVGGIGITTTKKIRWAVNEPVKEYN